MKNYLTKWSFRTALNFISSNEDIGKKSNFLLQEINREVNTIGSKVDNLETKRWL